MPQITLMEGDFGADAAISFDVDDLFLPDPDRPGLAMPVPHAEVAEMESINDDGLRPVKEALKLGAKGLFIGPSGLAAGFHSATKVKDVVFSVVLADGRRFVAVTDAKTYAELHSAQIAARAAAQRGGFGDDVPGPVDAVIAKYLDQAEEPANEAEPARAEPAARQVEPAPAIERRMEERRQQPSFGRRRPPR